MINKINELFNIDLSKEGKNIIKKWIVDEYETMYYAQKQLDTDEAIMDFINDMLVQENIRLDSLCKYGEKKKKEVKKKHFCYCPYCGEKL